MNQSLGFRLVQEQTQKLVMNQEMRQAITILQYSSMELADFIQKQVEENPLFDFDLPRKSASTGISGPFTDQIERLPQKGESLEEVLLEQLSYLQLTPKQQKIGRYIIGLIDRDGYFREEIGRIADELKCTINDVEEGLMIIQSFEPLGVGARDLPECLLLQLRAKGVLNSLAEEVITQHLTELADKRYSLVAHKCGVSIDEIKSIVALIEESTPRPGMLFTQAEVKYIAPDVYVDLKDGELILSLNDYILPSLRINETYRQLLQASEDEQTKSYLQERLKKALWMIKNIEQRRSTILNVTEAIFHHQKDFLSSGFDQLKPLTLLEIAKEIGVHESTVSRAVNQKYVQTPKGLFELKHFFVRGINTATGEAASSISIKRRIESLIQQEVKSKPLSDQEITDCLNQEGIQISRRTVMKYREEIKLPSSSKRRIRNEEN